MRKIARIIVGIILVIQTLMMLSLAVFIGFMGRAFGGMAMIVGGGKATDEQVDKAWMAINLLSASPLLLVVLCGAIAWLVLRNRNPWLLYGCTAVALALYIWMANLLMEGHWSHLTFDGVLPILFPLVGALLVSRPGERKDPGSDILKQSNVGS